MKINISGLIDSDLVNQINDIFEDKGDDKWDVWVAVKTQHFGIRLLEILKTCKSKQEASIFIIDNKKDYPKPFLLCYGEK